ncbi:colipase isoform X1 [Ictidomys tridecemlineatus]
MLLLKEVVSGMSGTGAGGEGHGEGRWAHCLSLQEDGEICMNSAQCKSSCCQHFSPLGVARCTRKASENSECSPKTLYGIYYKCPCERGLTCESDRTIIGAITNTNYGICLDAGRSKE